MTAIRWVGGAAAKAQKRTWLFGGAWVVGETITVTIGSKVYTATIASATIATFLTSLAAELAALTGAAYPEFAEIAWTADATHLIATARTAGYPFTAALSTNSAAGTIGAATDAVANTGPSSWAVAKNWSPPQVPVTGDAVTIDDPTYPILYDLDQSGVTLASLTVLAKFEGSDITRGTIGLPAINRRGTAYPEYRGRELKIASTGRISVGVGPGAGSGRINLNTGTAATDLFVRTTGRGQGGETAVNWKGTHAANVVNLLGGELGIAAVALETATVATLKVGPQSTLVVGDSVTLGVVTNDGGAIQFYSGVATSLTQQSGNSAVYGSGAVAQLSITGGTVVYNSTGTLGGNTTVDGGSVLDFSGDQQQKTVTNPITARGGSSVLDPLKAVTNLRVISPDGRANVLWGPSWTLARS